MENLEKLKDMVFLTDNKACFIERERILKELETEFAKYDGEDKYAVIFGKLLSRVSTPIDANDYFAGRVIEALPDEGMSAPSTLLVAEGHMSFDYGKLLKKGLSGILEEMEEKATQKGGSNEKVFFHNAKIVIKAIKDFAERYAKEAEKMGFPEMARALYTVPFYPAYDFYSALQGIWLIHMIASCYVGGRDYAFGRFDKYMLPFYENAIKDGKTKEELTEILAGFLIKTNEICGRNTHNYNIKPVLSQASKQYINIGGEKPNEFSSVVLSAAKLLNMAQPQIVVLLKPDADRKFADDVFEALSVLTDKMNIYNYDSIVKKLIKKGIEEEVAKDFSYSACCTFDLNYHSFRREHFVISPTVLLDTIKSGEYESYDEFVRGFVEKLKENISWYLSWAQNPWSEDKAKKHFVLDALLNSDSASELRYPCDGKGKYNVINMFFAGLATVGDSFMVLDKLVFGGKRYSLKEFSYILENNFAGYEKLRYEILSYEKFGNDSEADKYVCDAANAYLDAVSSAELKPGFIIAPGFYSLERENSFKDKVGATPDGRLAGEPFSENQSPTYGADKKGITALLNSLAKLPLNKTVTGGLNLTFAQKMSAVALKTLIVTYFEKGGLHVGISVLDKETLKDAMVNPDKYKSLTVRLYGFSEYFTNLPKWQQIAVLNRTEY